MNRPFGGYLPIGGTWSKGSSIAYTPAVLCVQRSAYVSRAAQSDELATTDLVPKGTRIQVTYVAEKPTAMQLRSNFLAVVLPAKKCTAEWQSPCAMDIACRFLERPKWLRGSAGNKPAGLHQLGLAGCISLSPVGVRLDVQLRRRRGLLDFGRSQ